MLLLLILYEILFLIEGIQTEYGLYKKIVEERNPLMRKKKNRYLIAYPLGFLLPLYLFFSQLIISNNIYSMFILCCFFILVGFKVISVIINFFSIYIGFKRDKNNKLQNIRLY